MPREVYEYAARLIRVKDGDTCVLEVAHTFTQEVDFGFYVKDRVALTKTAEITFRLHGLNAPEVYGLGKELGLPAKVELERLLSLGSIRAVTDKPDKYGRWLVTLYVTPAGAPEFNVNQTLIDTHFALPWDGQGEKPI